MLDENFPTFYFKQSTDNPLNNIVYFTQNGSEPAPEYVFKRADPRLPAAKNKYAVALGDAFSQDVVFAETLVQPDWQAPALSAAEARQTAGTSQPLVPTIPDSVTLQLYDPDQQVIVRQNSGSWGKSDTWDFEMPQQSFRQPSSSKLDRQAEDPVASDVTPKIMFKWKKDGKFSKDMTCFLSGRSLGGKKSKEPDITVAMFKQGRDDMLTIYEPNLNRVEVQDKKGLEVVLLLSAEAVKDLYLGAKQDVFNTSGAALPATVPGKRKNSKPLPPQAAGTAGGPSTTPPVTMSGALNNGVPPPAAGSKPGPPTTALNNGRPNGSATPSNPAVDAETKRLQAVIAAEQREREKKERAEERRIKRMLEEEERERRRKEAEVAKETERLRRQYGTQGQEYQRPNLPPRPTPPPQQSTPSYPQFRPAVQLWNSAFSGGHAPPQRPVSAGPPPQQPVQHHGPAGMLSNWFHGPSGTMVNNTTPPPPRPQPGPPPRNNNKERRRHGSHGSNSGGGLHPYACQALASSSTFLAHAAGRRGDERSKIQKKRSVFF